MRSRSPILALLALAACSSEPAEMAPRGGPNVRPGNSTPDEVPTPGGPTGEASLFCRYTNPFSRQPECKAYSGPSWTEETAREDCAVVFTGAMGVVDGTACETSGAIGTCTVDGGGDREAVTWYYGGDPEITASACQNFAQGVWAEGGANQGPATFGAPMPEALEALRSGGGVKVSPECQEDACVAELIDTRQAIELAPEGRSVRTGLVLYPGAGVDVRAYAQVARAIAAEGYLVALVPMPDRFALNGVDRAEDVIAAHAEITRWVVGGHSMGGAAAVSFSQTAPANVAGVVLWGSYPGNNETIRGRLVYSLHGTADAIVTPEEIAANRRLLPDDAQVFALWGANHAQFGAYGVQDGDGEPTIPRATQHALVAGATAHLLRVVEEGPSPVHPAFADADTKTAAFCAEAQRIVAGADADLLPDGMMRDEVWTDAVGFGRAKPGVDASRPVAIDLHSYAAQGANARWTREPAIVGGEIWCKLKSAEALAEAFGWSEVPAEASCADVNRAILEVALQSVTAAERTRYRASRREVVFEADVAATSGPEWYGGRVELVPDGAMLRLRSPGLIVPLDSDIEASGRGVHYCKMWSVARALEWVLFQGGSRP